MIVENFLNNSKVLKNNLRAVGIMIARTHTHYFLILSIKEEVIKNVLSENFNN